MAANRDFVVTATSALGGRGQIVNDRSLSDVIELSRFFRPGRSQPGVWLSQAQASMDKSGDTPMQNDPAEWAGPCHELVTQAP